MIYRKMVHFIVLVFALGHSCEGVPQGREKESGRTHEHCLPANYTASARFMQHQPASPVVKTGNPYA